MIRTLNGIAVLAMTTAAAWLAGAGDAHAQGRIACGEEFYTVQAGDALSSIAQRAYSSFNYQVIYEANRDVLASPSVLLVGQKLFIPCLDGQGPASKAEALGQPEGEATAAAETEANSPLTRQVSDSEPAGEAGEAEVVLASATPVGTVRQAVPALDRPIRFLTGSDHARFTHRDLPEGGMIPELVNRAMQRADALRPYRISWENDWDRHLTELLPGEEYDLGFPWFRPDCSRLRNLSEEMQARCTGFLFSEPLYEVPVAYFVTADSRVRDAEVHSALFGQRLCRPAGLFAFDLEAAQMVEPNVTLVRPETAGECFEQLAAGEVDVVSVEAATGEHEITQHRLRGRVIELPALATTETLHVVSAKSNPYGEAFLGLVDKGLEQLRAEGVWSEVTARHMADAGSRL